MIIECAMPTDAAEILALQKLAYQSEAILYNDFTIPPLTQTLHELTVEFRHRQILQVVAVERIIGSVQGFQVGSTCHVGRLMVHPERQGKGIGSRLMAAVEQGFPDVERFELFTGHKSLTNIRLYERLGYRVFREETVHSGLALVFMEKWRSADSPGHMQPTIPVDKGE